MLEKLHILITLAATIVVTIVNIVYNVTLQEALLRLIVVIVMFFIIGLFVKHYLIKNVFSKAEQDEEHNALPKLDGAENLGSYDADDMNNVRFAEQNENDFAASFSDVN